MKDKKAAKGNGSNKNNNPSNEKAAAGQDSQAEPKEIFDSSKYDAMNDMIENASLEPGKADFASDQEISDRIDARQINYNNKEDENLDTIESFSDSANLIDEMEKKIDNAEKKRGFPEPNTIPMPFEEKAENERRLNADAGQKFSTSYSSSMLTEDTALHAQLTEKLILYLNLALSIENAALQRLQGRIQQSPLLQTRQRLKQHLVETKEQKNRLVSLIQDFGGIPTEEIAELPSFNPPKILAEALQASAITQEEQELKNMEVDALIENAEMICYTTLIQFALKSNMGQALLPLRQSLKEEEDMVAWSRANLPSNFALLWPAIEQEMSGKSAQMWQSEA